MEAVIWGCFGHCVKALLFAMVRVDGFSCPEFGIGIFFERRDGVHRR